ncbi:MAG: SurA N-terminal domain-containing protein [Gammaproteobacteria bacterium]|nr:SurA N-terminal domain-containing protein [Gammaproteobacteria bacterium]
MLEKIRDGSQGIVAKSILGVVILSFALAGIGSYLGGSNEIAAAVVNGTNISNEKLEQKFQQERSRLESQFGEMFKAISADNAYMARIRQNVLERLVADELIMQMADKMSIRVGNEEIKQAIIKMPEFQVDGIFDNDRYLNQIRRAGYRVEQFREILRIDMTRQQLMRSLIATDFILENESTSTALLEQQRRDIKYIEVNSQSFLDNIEIDDSKVTDYYDLNNGQFKTQEQVSLQYIELKVSDLLSQVTVTDEAVKAAYDENIEQYQTEARRKVAHILIASTDDDAGDKAKAQTLLDKINSGEDFAAIAKTSSDDTFSGENGGDLDWIEPGVMDPAFDTAAFALVQDQVSALVKTSFGYHIIKVTDLEEQTTKAFTDVAESIRQELLANEAKEQFFEVQQQLADLSFEVPDTLDEAASAIGVKVQSTPLFTRANVPTALSNPAVLAAAYSDTVLVEGVNSDVIEITPDHHMVIRVTEHQPSEIKPLEQVKEQIVSLLKNQEAAEVAKVTAQEYLASWNANTEIADVKVIEKKAVARRTQDIDPAIVAAAFSLAKPMDAKFSNTLVSTNNGQAIVSLTGVNTVEDVKESLAAVVSRLERSQSDATYRSFIKSLINDSDVVYPAPEA